MRKKSKELKFERVYYAHALHMKRAAMTILKNEHQAEDAVHNSFVKIMNSPEKIDENNYSRTAWFLNTIARNEAKRIFKKERRLGVLEDIDDEAIKINDPVDIENLIIAKETLNRVLDIVKNMNMIYSDVFILHYNYQCTVKEIAELIEEKEDTIRKRLQRAKYHIADCLRKEKQI